MPIQTPPEVLAVLATFDSRKDAFEAMEVGHAVDGAVKDTSSMAPDARRALWAEWAAFSFSTRGEAGDGPWKTYFQPLMTGTGEDGSMVCRPDLGHADAEVLTYWAARAKAATHPVLVARYADLVWDTTEFVTKAKRGRDKFEFVQLAIDSYIAASHMDDGSAWGDTREHLSRALHLALSIKDAARIATAVNANIDYVGKTADEDELGTYCYLFDNLLPAEKGPVLAEEQERDIIKMFEEKFTKMTTPGGPWDVDPHSPRDVGLRLAAYYERKGKPDDRKRVIGAIAAAFERRAQMGDAMSAMFFLQDARDYFLLAGMKNEAERVQREGQKTGPEAQKQLVPMTAEHDVPKEEVERFLGWLMERGMADGLLRLTRHFVPDQVELAKRAAEIAAEYPLASIIMGSSKVLGHGHIQADLGADADDPDGKTVHRTSEHLHQFDRWWLHWGLDHMTSKGLNAAQVMEFIRPCPLFTEDHIPLVQQGVEAHFAEDFPKSIHLLIPQIERALVNVLPLAGKPSNKAHRTGRGVMQAKSLNDVLTKEEWPLPGESGERLRVYFLSVLAHPKGLNIRNFVCHGLWPAGHFTKPVSERVLHVLMTVSLIRPAKGGGVAERGAPNPTGNAPIPVAPDNRTPKSKARGPRTAN